MSGFIRAVLSGASSAPFSVMAAKGRRCVVCPAIRHPGWIYRRRPLRSHRGSGARASRTVGLACAAGSFRPGDPRQYYRRARHGESRQLLLLLPRHDNSLPGPAVGRMAAAIGGPSVRGFVGGKAFMNGDFGAGVCAVTDRPRADSDYVFHELTRSICPALPKGHRRQDPAARQQSLHEQAMSRLRAVHGTRLRGCKGLHLAVASTTSPAPFRWRMARTSNAGAPTIAACARTTSSMHASGSSRSTAPATWIVRFVLPMPRRDSA